MRYPVRRGHQAARLFPSTIRSPSVKPGATATSYVASEGSP